MIDILECLSKVFPFSELTKKELEEIAKDADLLKLSRKEALFQSGSPCDAVYVVVSGGIKLTKTNYENNSNLILEIFAPGEVIAEEALIPGTAYDTSAIPLDKAEIIKLNLKQIYRLFESNSKFAQKWMQLLFNSSHRYREKMSALVFKSVNARLAMSLLHLLKGFGKRVKNGNAIDARITHQDLAEYIGASRETVSLALGNFKKQRLISVNIRQLIIPDPKALKKIANS